MADEPQREFGKRRPAPPTRVPQPPVKRSGHVALLVMGTLAVGGGAYALMPPQCAPTQPGMAAPTGGAACTPRSSGSGGGGSGYYGGRSGFYGSDSSTSRPATGAPAQSGTVTRGGFGSFARSFAAHFSGGG